MFDPWVGKFLWRREWQSTPIFLPGEFHGQRSLVGYSPWGHKESDKTERLTFPLFQVSESAIWFCSTRDMGFSWLLRWSRICLQCRRPGFNPWVGKIPWRREWQSTPIFIPGEFHGQRSLEGYSPLGCKESDKTERLTHTREINSTQKA